MCVCMYVCIYIYIYIYNRGKKHDLPSIHRAIESFTREQERPFIVYIYIYIQRERERCT